MAKFNIPVQGIPTIANAYADILGKDMENQIIDIPNEKIIENNNQNFKIHEDTIEQLAERIAKDGQLSPCIVTPLSDGNYELVDGRHRRRAIIKAGLPTTKCIIKKDLTEKQKATYRISLNVFRNNDYLPSEIALSLKELVELEGSHDAIKKIADETSTSRKKIYRYLRLTYLIKPLLDKVDNGSIPVIAAVELSYLKDQQQKKLSEYLLIHPECKINTSNAKLIKNKPNDDLDNIFYSATDKKNSHVENELLTTENNISMDNLSTNEIKSNFIDTNYKKIDIDGNGTISLSSGCYDYLSSDEQKTIAEFVINKTHADFYMLRYAYTSQEIIKLFDENYKNHVSGFGGNIEFDWHYRGSGKNLKLSYNGKKFIIPFKVLDEIIRLYVRNEYTTDKIISVINS